MRILHTMLRVNNLDESIEFYKNFFGWNKLYKPWILKLNKYSCVSDKVGYFKYLFESIY